MTVSPCHVLGLGLARRTVDGRLTTQLFQHFGCSCESVTRFADRDVQHELLDAQLAHRVGALVISFRLHFVRKVNKNIIDILS